MEEQYFRSNAHPSVIVFDMYHTGLAHVVCVCVCV
jgi:hypothetical protein